MTRLAIIAGQGNLPLQVARAADEKGYDVVIFPIKGQADAMFDGLPFSLLGLARLDRHRAF